VLELLDLLCELELVLVVVVVSNVLQLLDDSVLLDVSSAMVDELSELSDDGEELDSELLD